LALMGRVQRAYVDQGDRQLHVRTAGEGRALLLVHQNAHSSSMWEALMPELAANGRRAIALDLPGYGLSDPFPVPPSLRDYASSALSLLDVLGVGEFDVLGQHLGASVGLRLAVDVPARVGGGIGFGIFLPGGRFESAVTAAAPPVYDRAGAEVMRQWEIRWQLGGAKFTPEMAVRSVAANLEAGERRHLGLLAMKDSDHEAMVRDLTRPFLGISSHRDSFFEETQHAAALNSHVSFRDVGEEGLFFAEENPREYARIVEDFLSSID
jgi:pimeloyl-ACP methyl ester carboxylesterase